MIPTDEEARLTLINDLKILANLQAKKVAEIYSLLKESYIPLLNYLTKQKDPYRVLKQLGPLNFSSTPLSKSTEHYITDYYRDVMFIPQLESRIEDEGLKTVSLFPKLSFVYDYYNKDSLYPESEQYRVWNCYCLTDTFERTLFRRATNFFVIEASNIIYLVRIPYRTYSSNEPRDHARLEPWTLWGHEPFIYDCKVPVDLEELSVMKVLPNGDCLFRQSSSGPVSGHVSDIIAGKLTHLNGNSKFDNTTPLAIDISKTNPHFRIKLANSNSYPAWVGTDLLDGSQYFSPWYSTEKGNYLEFIRVIELGCYNLSKKLRNSEGTLICLNYKQTKSIKWMVINSNLIDVRQKHGYTGREAGPVYFKPGDRLEKFVSAAICYYKPTGVYSEGIFSVLTNTNPVDLGLHLSDSYEKYKTGYENVIKLVKELNNGQRKAKQSLTEEI